MDSQILTAVMAGVVALIVSLMTWAVAQHKDQSDRMRQERELLRKLTEKHHELRAGHYPRAFSITQGLLGNLALTLNRPGLLRRVIASMRPSGYDQPVVRETARKLTKNRKADWNHWCGSYKVTQQEI